MKDKFFGIIAHDLKNPFSGLIGASELLVTYANEFDKENIRNISLSLNDSAKQGYALLENLLEWSRSQTGKLEFNPQKVNLKALIDEHISNLGMQVVTKNIRLNNKVADDIEIMADINLINTVLRNLLSNAVKFTEKEGMITVHADRLKNHVAIAVKDTGIGISRDNIDKLFRIDDKYTREGTEHESGTGLGLLLCKEFVEKHGGKIWVESQEGKGSEFIFSIPSLPY
jgi:signal transduction histidine kinase